MKDVTFEATIGLAVIIAQMADFAVRDLKSQNKAESIRIRLSDPTWGDNAVFSALSFSKRYLDLVLGPRLFLGAF